MWELVVPLVLVAALFVGAAVAAYRHRPPADVHEAAYHTVEFPHEVAFLLTLYAIGWEVEQIRWWRHGVCWHDIQEG